MARLKSSTASVGTRISAKSGTRKGRKSIVADGNFIADLRDLGYFDRVDGSASSVVYAPITLPTSETRSKPKPWRDIHEEVRGLFFHAAMKKATTHHHGFTLRLSEHVEALARDKRSGCLSWLHRRVVRQLRLTVGALGGASVQFWFAIEEDDRGILHLHGEISVDPALRELIRTALDDAGGNWPSPGKGYAPVRFETDPDFRWCGYSLKSAHRARPSRRQLMNRLGVSSSREWLARFEGKAVTASEALRVVAINLHTAAVAEVVASTKRPAIWGIF
jgi:hypothetical protein